jgi:hypothetical protein
VQVQEQSAMLLTWNVDDGIVGTYRIERLIWEGQLCHILANELGLWNQLASQLNLSFCKIYAGDLKEPAQEFGHRYSGAATGVQHLRASGQPLHEFLKQLHILRVFRASRKVLGGYCVVACSYNVLAVHDDCLKWVTRQISASYRFTTAITVTLSCGSTGAMNACVLPH